MPTDNDNDPGEGFVSVRIEQDGNGQITEVEIIDGRWSDEWEICDIIAQDPSIARTTRVFGGYRNGGDSLEETDRYDRGAIFHDNWK